MTFTKQLENHVASKIIARLVPFGFKKSRDCDVLVKREIIPGVEEQIGMTVAHYRNKGISLSCGPTMIHRDIAIAVDELASDPGYYSPTPGKLSRPTMGTGLEQLMEPPMLQQRSWDICSIEEAEECANHLIIQIESLAIPWLEKNANLPDAYDTLVKKIKTDRFPKYSSILWFTAYVMTEKMGLPLDQEVMKLIMKLAEGEERGYRVARKIVAQENQKDSSQR